MMKKNIISAVAALICCLSAWGQVPISVSDIYLGREGDKMKVAMRVNLTMIEDVQGAVSFVPMICKDSISFALSPIGLYSRSRFYVAARNARSDDPFDGVPYTYYIKNAPDSLYYSDAALYRDWMSGATLRIDTLYTGCCDRLLIRKEGQPLAIWEEPEVVEEEQPVVEQPVEEQIVVAEYHSDDEQIEAAEEQVEIPISEEDVKDEEIVQVYVPYFIYMQPEAETIVKERAISGEAYVVFKSGATDVDAAYKDNEAELQKIRATVDSVRVDPDISITKIVLRGYSSPDGKFSVNQELSEKRVQAIRAYVEALFELPEEVWSAEAGGENWEGFRKAVEEATNLPNKAKILALIDSDQDPDRKEYKISKYTKDYKIIFNNIYPMLRRTDYKVMYTVRSYTTVEEVREILNTKPWNLSLKEFFLAADGLEPGTAEFNKVFQLAAMVYPDEPIAQINAANAAMAMGALDLAEEHLAKAGDSPEARYTKGVLAALREDWETAAKYFSSAQLSGLEKAGEALETVEAILKQRQP